MKRTIYCIAEVHPTNLEYIGRVLLKLGWNAFLHEYKRISEALGQGIPSFKQYSESVEGMLRHVNDLLIGADMIARVIEIEEREKGILERIRRPCVYLEGIKGLRTLLESHVYSMNGRIVYLDEGFSPYTSLKKEDGTPIRKVKEIQHGREIYWKTRMQENPPTFSEIPVAIAGRNHFRNTVDLFLKRMVNRITNRYVGSFGEKLKELGYLPVIYRVY